MKAQHANQWRIPSEMNIDLFDKTCNVDSEPSSLHCGDRLTGDELKARRSLVEKKPSFKYPSHLPKFGMAVVDHPKHGLPFIKRQQIRSFLKRKIESMEKELRRIPTYPRHNQEIRMEISRSLNEEELYVRRTISGERKESSDRYEKSEQKRPRKSV